jgi:hypothetical protein
MNRRIPKLRRSVRILTRTARLPNSCTRTPDTATQSTFVFLIPFIMLARRTLARIPAQQASLGAAPQNARNMATLRELELRLKSVRNIEKITKVRVWRPFVRSMTYSGTHIVDEDDCLHTVSQGSTCSSKRQAVRNCQRRCVNLNAQSERV